MCINQFVEMYFLAFYAEIQNGHQKWREKYFWEKLPVDSADKLRVKNFVKRILRYHPDKHTLLKNMFLGHVTSLTG